MGTSPDLHLDTRAVVEVEAAQVDVVAEALAVLVVDEEARGRREHLARLLAGRGREDLAVDADVAEAARGRPGDAADADRDGLVGGAGVGVVVAVGLAVGVGGGGAAGAGVAAAPAVAGAAGGWNTTTYSMRDRIGWPSREDGVNRAALTASLAARTNASGASWGSARELDRRLDRAGRVDHDLQRHLRLDGRRVRRKGRDDGRDRFGRHDVRGCCPCDEQAPPPARGTRPRSREPAERRSARAGRAVTSGSRRTRPTRSDRKRCCRPARST